MDFTRDGAYGNEDLDLGYRLRQAGQRIVFNERAVSRQRYVVTPAQYLRQWRQVGRADVMLARKHPEEADGLFHRSRTERRLDRLLFRWLRPALRPRSSSSSTPGRSGRGRSTSSSVSSTSSISRGCARPAGSQVGHPVRVLCYHSIADLAGDPVLEPYGVPRPEFRRHLELLDRHFCLIGPDEFFRYLEGTGGVPRQSRPPHIRRLLQRSRDARHSPSSAPGTRRHSHSSSPGRVGGTNDWDAHLGAGSIALVDEDGLEALRRGRHRGGRPLANASEPEEHSPTRSSTARSAALAPT